MAKKSPIDHVATENQSCGCYKKLSKKDIELYKSRLNKFKVQNIDDTDLFSIPMNFHIVADQEFFNMDRYEEQVRENIMNNIEQLNLDWNGRNPDRNRTYIPQAEFWANRGEQDKFSFYVNSIRTINTDGTRCNANTFINFGRTQEIEKFGDYYRFFQYDLLKDQEDQNNVRVYPYDSLSDMPTPPSDLNGFYEVDGQYYTWNGADFVNDPNNQPALPVEYVYGYTNGLHDNDRTGRSEVRLKGTKANVLPFPEYLYYPTYPQGTYFRAIASAVDQDKSLNVWLVPDILEQNTYLDENNNSVLYWDQGPPGFATFPDIGHPQMQGIVMLLGAVGSVDKPSQVSLPASLYSSSTDENPVAPNLQKDDQGNILPSSDVKSNPYKYDKPQADGTTKATPRLYPPSQNGRNLTHEVGHYFGLTHTWGDVKDDNGYYVCGGPLQDPTLDPEVNDPMISYPKQKGPSSNRSLPPSLIMANECTVDAPWVQSEGVMWQNFMDYAVAGYLTTRFMFTKQQQDALQAICTDDDSERKILSQPDKILKLSEQAYQNEPDILSTQGHAVSNVVLGGQTVSAIAQNGVTYAGWNPVESNFSIPVSPAPDNNYALSSPVNVTVSGGKYYFDGQDPDQYTVTSGSYLFQNIPSSHPMAFTMNQAGQNVVFGGQGANAVGQKTSTIDGQTYTYWHGDIILYITGPSNDFSYECYYHGPMGGQDRMKNLAT